MKAGVDYAMVLSEKLITRIPGDSAKLVIDVVDDSSLIGNRDNCRLIEREFYVGKFFERAPKHVAMIRRNVSRMVHCQLF